MSETKKSHNNDEAIELIDKSLGTLSSRQKVSSIEMGDVLLDLRSILMRDVDLELALMAEVQTEPVG